MGRWTDDDVVVPSGMERIGYDTDTQRYTFRDSNGCIYEGGTYGGALTLVSRPKQNSAQDDEPIRLMPNSPSRASHKSTASPTSPMSFRDFLPPDAMTSAPPKDLPRRKVTMKTAAPASLQRSQTSPSREPTQRSLWSLVRNKTAPTKMRDVVNSVVRRPSKSSSNSTDHTKDRRYERLSGDSSRLAHPPSRHGKQTTA